MSAITRQLKTICIAVLLLIGTSAGLWFLSSLVTTYGNTLKETIQTVKNNKAFETHYAEVTNIVASTEETRHALDSYVLTDERDTIAFLSEMDQIAAQQGVILETSRLEMNETTDIFDQIAITFVIEGSEWSVMRMIEIFENLPYHGDVVSLSLSHTTSEATGGRVAKATIALLLSIQNYD